MRRCRALLLALLIGAAAGCAGERSSSTSLLHRLRPFQGVTGPDAVQIDVALVQIPYGDAARYRELWTFLDEQAVALDKKSALEENGFRVGRVGANPPEELLELVSQRRSCPDPRRVQMLAGKDERAFDLGPVLHKASLEIIRGEQSMPVELEDALCCLGVTPVAAEDGRTRLQIVPKVKQTRGPLGWLPRPDRSGWTRQFEPVAEKIADLGWEVTMAPGEYLVIGAREDKPGTLGHQAFVRPDEGVPVKRLLVLRTWREGGGPKLAEREPVPDGSPRRAPPLAVQAGLARGVHPE